MLSLSNFGKNIYSSNENTNDKTLTSATTTTTMITTATTTTPANITTTTVTTSSSISFKDPKDVLIALLIKEYQKNESNEIWLNIKRSLNEEEEQDMNIKDKGDISKILEEINQERRKSKETIQALMNKLNQYEKSMDELHANIKSQKLQKEIIRFSAIKMENNVYLLKKTLFDLLCDKAANNAIFDINQSLLSKIQTFYEKGTILNDEQYHSNFFTILIMLINRSQKQQQQRPLVEMSLEENIDSQKCPTPSIYSPLEIFDTPKKLKENLKSQKQGMKRSGSNFRSFGSNDFEINKYASSSIHQPKKSLKTLKRPEPLKEIEIKPKSLKSTSPTNQIRHKSPMMKSMDLLKKNSYTPSKLKKTLSNQKGTLNGGNTYSPVNIGFKRNNHITTKSKNTISPTENPQIDNKPQDPDYLKLPIDKLYNPLLDDKEQEYSSSQYFKSCETEESDTRKGIEVVSDIEHKENIQPLLQRKDKVNINVEKKGDESSIVKLENKAQTFDILINENQRMLKLLFEKKNDAKSIEYDCSFGSIQEDSKGNLIANKKSFEESIIYAIDGSNQNFSLHFEANLFQDIPHNIKTEGDICSKNNQKVEIIEIINPNPTEKKHQGDLTLADLEEVKPTNFDYNKPDTNNPKDINLFSQAGIQILEAPSPRFGKFNKFLTEESPSSPILLQKCKDFQNIETNTKSSLTSSLKKNPASVSVAMGTILGKIKAPPTYQNLKPLRQKK